MLTYYFKAISKSRKYVAACVEQSMEFQNTNNVVCCDVLKSHNNSIVEKENDDVVFPLDD